MSSETLQAKALKKVLIVEDEGEMCLLLNILLNGEEMELDHVKTLETACDYLEQQKPDAVILDNKLPDGYGIDLITYIKKNSPATRIIMISGFDGAAKDVALEAGADAYLEKPFTKEQLFGVVNKVLK
jgi:two-component system, OmpR family, response regulator